MERNDAELMEKLKKLADWLEEIISSLRTKKHVDIYLEARYFLYEYSHNVSMLQYMVDEIDIIIDHSKAEYFKENKWKYKSDAATERMYLMDNSEEIMNFQKKEAKLRYFVNKMKSYNSLLDSISFSFIQENVERKRSNSQPKV